MAPERTPPSGEEVARRLSSLYDQAELASGNFNGTRALANSTRRPGRRGAGQGGGVSDPAQEDLMRQLYDGARSRFGPSAPAILPADRQQARGGESARPREGAKGARGPSAELPTVYQLEQIVRPVAELTAAPMRELTAGPASEPAARPVLELTAGPAAGSAPAPGADTAGRAALPAGSVPEAASPKPSLHVKKQTARRKLAAAQELMARHAARQSMPVAQVPAIEYRPVEEPQLPSYPSVGQTGSFPSVGQTGSFPSVGQTGSFPSVGQTGSFPSVGQTGSFPSVGQTGSFPSVGQAGSFPSVGQTGSFPSVGQTGSFPLVGQTGSFPAAAQAPVFQAAPQPAPYEPTPQPAAPRPEPMPAVFDTGSMPRAYEAAPPTGEYRSVLLPLGYEPPPPPSEYTSVLLPLAYETPARPSGYQPAPMPPVSEPVPQPPAYEPAPGPVAYQPAPAPPAGPPAPPSADDAWRQALRPAGERQTWPAAPAAVDTNPGFSIDSLVAPAAPPVVGPDSRAAEAVAFARAQIGRPCVWGASGPGSYDPSGLTQASWKSAGVMLPRATQDQAQVGPAVALGAMQPGDLVFFHANVSHVGLYVGDGMMVHAPSPGARIAEESVAYAGQAAIHSVVRPV
ncbi:NlpC/P60 family protein [Streptomyces sp. SAS_267]|uniref:NlpC/P60 family protein n=1 Tax=Streptomyces sp. SAS_267 TaxID=3412750 RepID=UPI00403D3E5C